MTRSLTAARQQQMQQTATALKITLDKLQPLLRQMHLLSSNAVSSAARAGSEGDAFRVLTQAIQQLGQDINKEVQQAYVILSQLLETQNKSALKNYGRQLDSALAELPIAVRKGEYLAICSSVEAAHADGHSDSFDAVANMLKQLITDLRQQVSQQQQTMSELLELI